MTSATPCDGPAAPFSRVPVRPSRARPCLGKHTQRDLGASLGLDGNAVARNAVEGALS